MAYYTHYAPPDVFGPWKVIESHINGPMEWTITVAPVGDTVIIGEVRFFGLNGTQQVLPFNQSITFRTCNCAANIEVHFKGVPTGSAVEGTISSSGLAGDGGGPQGASATPQTSGARVAPPAPSLGTQGALRVLKLDGHSYIIAKVSDKLDEKGNYQIDINVTPTSAGPAGAGCGTQCCLVQCGIL